MSLGQSSGVYNCTLCSESFSLSVALLIHKVYCHSWAKHGKAANLFTYFGELIREEKKYSSDENFDYTFIITTSVIQTSKQIKTEQFSDIMTNELDPNCISEPLFLQQTLDLEPASSVETYSAEGKHKKTKEDPLKLETFETTVHENSINVTVEEYSLNTVKKNEEICIKLSIQPDNEVFDTNQERCPLCQRALSLPNLRRHLRKVHNLTKSQINKMNLNARFKCLVCLQNLTKYKIKHHFKVDHNISDSSEVERLHVAIKLSSVPYEDEKSKPIAHHDYVGCTLCTKTFLSMNLKRHLRMKHKLNDSEIKKNLQHRLDGSFEHILSEDGNHQKTFESSSNLREVTENVSLIRRQGRRGYFCTLCDEEFTMRPLIMQHFVNNHSDTIAQMTDAKFECDLCRKLLPSFAIYEIHQNEHIDNPDQQRYLCNYCGKYLKSTLSLDNHIAGHMNLRQFVCDICHKTKNDKSSLRIHMIMHMNEKPHKCPVSGCGAAYSILAKLREHKILHHTNEKKHQCDICFKKFKLKTYLK